MACSMASALPFLLLSLILPSLSSPISPSPSPVPSPSPSPSPSPFPSPARSPSLSPSPSPSLSLSPVPSYSHSPVSSPTRSSSPSPSPSPSPLHTPSNSPSYSPVSSPSPSPSPLHTPLDSPSYSPSPSPSPLHTPSDSPSYSPVSSPSPSPLHTPSDSPSYSPVSSLSPSPSPLHTPSDSPSYSPVSSPLSDSPSYSPVSSPLHTPSDSPSHSPVSSPPSDSPSYSPVSSPPSDSPSYSPVSSPPSDSPSYSPVSSPLHTPSDSPSYSPVSSPSPSPSHPPVSSPTPSPQIQIQYACNATRHADLCRSSLSQFPGLTPIDLIRSSISVSLVHVRLAKSKTKAVLNVAPPNVNRTNVASNCLQGLTYSHKRLAAASRALLAGTALADARAWASAALLYHHGCWSGFQNVNDIHEVADAVGVMSMLTNLTSNALSMVAALQRYGGDTSRWAPLMTERQGYWGPDGGAGHTEHKAEVPSGLAPNATVCKEKGCRYRSVQAAIGAAPMSSMSHVSGGGKLFVIYIKKGVYEETVRVEYKRRNVVLIGDGMGKTVITGNLSVGGTVGLSTYNTATLGVIGDGFMAANLTISNTAGPDVHQAVAFRSDSDLSVLQNVEFIGHQDTLYARSLRQLYKSCVVYGTVDFIFGDSAAVFKDTSIVVVPRQLSPEKGGVNTVTAQARVDPAQSTGYVFDGCVVNGSAEYLKYYREKPASYPTYLGRPWRAYSRTVFLNCVFDAIVNPEGWLPWSGDFALGTLFYGEFNSTGPGANATGRVPWSSLIPEAHLSAYSTRNFLQMG